MNVFSILIRVKKLHFSAEITSAVTLQRKDCAVNTDLSSVWLNTRREGALVDSIHRAFSDIQI